MCSYTLGIFGYSILVHSKFEGVLIELLSGMCVILWSICRTCDIERCFTAESVANFLVGHFDLTHL